MTDKDFNTSNEQEKLLNHFLQCAERDTEKNPVKAWDDFSLLKRSAIATVGFVFGATPDKRTAEEKLQEIVELADKIGPVFKSSSDVNTQLSSYQNAINKLGQYNTFTSEEVLKFVEDTKNNAPEHTL